MSVPYVDSPVDWVRPHPLRFADARMHVLLLPARKPALRALCDAFFTGPTQGKVEVVPLLSAVVLCFASIRRGTSVPESGTGFLSENECVFFVPVLARSGAGFRVGVLAPLAYVDNPIAVVAGREIYGFPKFPAEQVLLDPEAGRFRVDSFAQTDFATDAQAASRTVLSVRDAGGNRSSVDLPDEGDDLSLDVLASLVEGDEATLELPPDLALQALPSVNLLFLKQFRDAADSSRTGLQEVVATAARISRPRQPRLHRGRFEVNFPRLARPAIPAWLGLDETIEVRRFLSLTLDFEFGVGTKLWSSMPR